MERVLVTGRDNEKFISEVKKYNLDLEFVTFGSDYQIYVGYSPLNYDLSKCRWVHSLGAGVDQFNGKNIKLLTRTSDQFGATIAGYCLAFIMNHKYNISKYIANQSKAKWEQYPYRKETVIIYGAGSIAKDIAKMLKPFDIDCYGVNTSGKNSGEFVGVTADKINDYLPKSTFIINTMPLTDKTNNYFDQTFFNKCNGQVFINVGRGKSVDSDELLKALEQGKIKNAVLDVFEYEPLDEQSPLWKKTIITPHVSGLTDIPKAAKLFVETYNRIQNNEILPNIVDVKKQY